MELNESLSIREWFDHDNNWQRREERRAGVLVAIIDDFRTERRYTIEDSDHDNLITYKDRCEVSPETYGPFSGNTSSAPRLESSTDFFRFGAQFNPQFIGMRMVRGIRAEVWDVRVRNQSRPLPNGGRSDSEYDILFSFAAEGWEAFSFRRGPGSGEGEHSPYRVPLRALVSGARITFAANGDVVDVHRFQHSYEYVRFWPEAPPPTLSRPPGAACNPVPARSFGPPSAASPPPVPTPSPEPTMPAFPTAYSTSFDYTSEMYVDPAGPALAADAPTGWVGSTSHVREFFDSERQLARMDVLAPGGERVTLLEDLNRKVRYRISAGPATPAAPGEAIDPADGDLAVECQVFYAGNAQDILTDDTGHLRPSLELFGLHGTPGVDFNVTYKGLVTARGTVPAMQFDAQFQRTGASAADGLFFETEEEEAQEVAAGEEEGEDGGDDDGPPLGPRFDPSERFVCSEGVASFFFVADSWPVYRTAVPGGGMSGVPLEVQYRGRRRWCHEDGSPVSGAEGEWKDFRSDVSFAFFDPHGPTLESLTEHSLNDVGLENLVCDTAPYCASAPVPDRSLCGEDGGGGSVAPPSAQSDCPSRTEAQLREEVGLAAGTFVLGLVFGGAFAMMLYYVCCGGGGSSGGATEGAGAAGGAGRGSAYSGRAMQPSSDAQVSVRGAAPAPGFEQLEDPTTGTGSSSGDRAAADGEGEGTRAAESI